MVSTANFHKLVYANPLVIMPVEKEQLNFEEASVRSGKPGKGIFLRANQVVFIIIVAAAVVICVAVLCYYVPERKCSEESRNGIEPITPSTQPPAAQTTAEPSGPWPGRLPTDVLPHSFNLYLKPYIDEEDIEGTEKEQFTFDGRVTIRVTCETATSRITLHILDIDINTLVVKKDGEVIESSYEFEDEYQFIRIDVETELEEGRDVRHRSRLHRSVER